MTEVIISALIASLTSLLVTLVSQIFDKKDIERRLQELEEKIDKHNSYGDKISKIQSDIAVIKTEITYLNK